MQQSGIAIFKLIICKYIFLFYLICVLLDTLRSKLHIYICILYYMWLTVCLD